MLRDINEIQALATKYSKQQLSHMAQMGMIDPTKAVMAGMMIDRIEKQNMQPPQTTVAQDVLQAPMPQGAPQQMGQGAPQQAQAGMTSLPSNVGNYAGGGIVAFDDGGDVRDELAYLPDDEIAALDANQVLRGRGSAPKAGVSDKLRKFLETKDQVQPSPARNRAGQVISDRPAPYAAPTVSADEMNRYIEANKGMRSLLEPKPSVDTVAQPFVPNATGIVAAPNAPRVVSAPRAPAPVMPKDAIAPAAPTLPSIDTNIPVELTKKPEATTALAEQQKREQHYAEMGIDPQMYEKLIAGQEEKRSKLPSKDEALGYALMQAGFGLMGARRGQEWQTLGKEAQGALTSYQGALKERRTLEDKIDEAKQALVLANNQYKKTGADADLAKVEARQEKIDALTAQDVKAKNEAASKSKELATHIYGYERSAAASELASLRSLIGTRYSADQHRATAEFVHNAPPAQLQAVNAILTDMRLRNPNATLVDAYNVYGGQGKSGVLSDEDLFKSWDKRYSEGKKLTASKEEKKFAQDFPTWQSYADAMRKQGGAPASTPGAGGTGDWGKMSVSGQ